MHILPRFALPVIHAGPYAGGSKTEAALRADIGGNDAEVACTMSRERCSSADRATEDSSHSRGASSSDLVVVVSAVDVVRVLDSPTPRGDRGGSGFLEVSASHGGCDTAVMTRGMDPSDAVVVTAVTSVPLVSVSPGAAQGSAVSSFVGTGMALVPIIREERLPDACAHLNIRAIVPVDVVVSSSMSNVGRTVLGLCCVAEKVMVLNGSGE